MVACWVGWEVEGKAAEPSLRRKCLNHRNALREMEVQGKQGKTGQHAGKPTAILVSASCYMDFERVKKSSKHDLLEDHGAMCTHHTEH